MDATQDKKRVLAISPHSDDVFAAAGGTLIRLIEEGWDIYHLAFSIAEQSVPEGFARDVVRDECLAAGDVIGIDRANVEIKSYPVRTFPSIRQQILDDLIELRERVGPSLILTPSRTDIHQDHQTVYQEAIRAFRKNASIYGYDFPWNNLHEGKLNLFYALAEEQLERKIDALSCFKSQLAKPNTGLTEEYIRALALERGNRIGAKYAEAFEMVREVR